jgi:hypothetical protein
VSTQPTYVAPARYALDCLHIPEPGAEADQAVGMAPLTRCGITMEEDDLWVPVERTDGDRVCSACDGLEAAPSEDALWLAR